MKVKARRRKHGGSILLPAMREYYSQAIMNQLNPASDVFMRKLYARVRKYDCIANGRVRMFKIEHII